MNMHPPPQDTTLKQRACHHPNTTRAGTNAYQTKITCKDCGFILHLMKKDPAKPMQTQDRWECPHVRKDWRGTTATTWRWRCLNCGETATGYKNPGETGAQAVEAAPHRVGQVGQWLADDPPAKVLEMMQLTIGIHKDTTGLVTGDQLDLIYRRCKDKVYGAPVTSQRVDRPMPATPPRPSSSMAQESFHTPQRAPQSPVPSRTGSAPSTPGDRTLGPREVLPQDLSAWDAEILDNGQQKGKTFRMVAETEHSYCNYLTGQH